eukprot:SAG31_NODE_786_length_12098_cov_15.117446_14_plen_100_part_01
MMLAAALDLAVVAAALALAHRQGLTRPPGAGDLAATDTHLAGSGERRSSAAAAKCSSDLDCALAGSCGADGACRCDPGWKTPGDGGTPCSAFDILPANPM